MQHTYNLNRFEEAHARDFETALAEINAGRKRSHWMWYIFPQMRGLGRTETADYYGIKDLNEAAAFLAHPVLGHNLIRISDAAADLPSSNATAIFGTPDDLKLRSSMTLFSVVPDTSEVFQRVINKYFGGVPDERTRSMLGLA